MTVSFLFFPPVSFQCSSKGHRPKTLLVYINPYGGKRRAKCVYEHKVAPLFRCAGITTDVIGRYI